MIKITEKMIKDAFDAAKTDESKNILTALFGPQEKKVKPTLDDYTTIKTYEDACEALGLAPIYSDLSKDADRAICQYSEAQRQYGYIMKLPKHILALMKLETISRALWGRNWEPTPDTNESKWFYYPYFALWTKDELNDINEKQRGTLLHINACNGVFTGLMNVLYLQVSVIWVQIVALHLRLRLLDSGYVRRPGKRLHISDVSLLNCGLNI